MMELNDPGLKSNPEDVNTRKSIGIVIPCYNEEKKLNRIAFNTFIQDQKNLFLCFVNDGSTDGTSDILKIIQQENLSQIDIVNLPSNKGKAEAVRQGMQHCLQHLDCEILAYLDADLAVSLEECFSICCNIDENCHFCFGSRILKVGSIIERKRMRHLAGRIIATAISETLGIKVYDTQCGCKVFRTALAEEVFVEPFISRWLFDVEIFFRIIEIYGKDEALSRMLEIPLRRWVDQGDSKVKMSYGFRLGSDLLRIRNRYR